MVSGYFTPSTGFFSSFPHGTCSLSVTREYLGLEGGPAGFTRISRARATWDIAQKFVTFRLRGSALYADPFAWLQLHTIFDSPFRTAVLRTIPTAQRLQAITQFGLACSAFRSPLLTESLFFSSFRVLLDVSVPVPPLALCVRVWCRLTQPGFPIRTSPDHSSVIGLPRLIAASYVLLRLLVPEHPPSALINLTTE